MASACAAPPGVRVTEVDPVTVVENLDDGAWAGHPDALRLVLEQAYGVEEEPQEAVLGNAIVLRFAASTAGDVYVQDPGFGRLVKFRPDGSVAWTAGRPGQGPGEFRAVTGVALTPDEQAVVVSNFEGRIDTWSADGEFQGAAIVDAEWRGGLDGFAGGRMVFSRGLPRRLGAEVLVVDPRDLSHSSTFEVGVAGDAASSFPRSVSIRPHGDRVAAGSNASYELRFHDLDGRLIRRVQRRASYPVRPGYVSAGSQRRRHDFGFVAAPMKMPGSRFLVYASWEAGITDPDATATDRGTEPGWTHPENWRMSLDLFDADGRLLQSIVPPGPIRTLGARAYPAELGIPRQVVGAGPGETPYLFTLVVDPFPQIRRYRIEVDPPAGAVDR